MIETDCSGEVAILVGLIRLFFQLMCLVQRVSVTYERRFNLHLPRGFLQMLTVVTMLGVRLLVYTANLASQCRIKVVYLIRDSDAALE